MQTDYVSFGSGVVTIVAFGLILEALKNTFRNSRSGKRREIPTFTLLESTLEEEEACESDKTSVLEEVEDVDSFKYFSDSDPILCRTPSPSFSRASTPVMVTNTEYLSTDKLIQLLRDAIIHGSLDGEFLTFQDVLDELTFRMKCNQEFIVLTSSGFKIFKGYKAMPRLMWARACCVEVSDNIFVESE